MNAIEHLLCCLGEECLEVALEAAALEAAKMASKANRFGPQDRNVLDPTGPTNVERLVDELNDMIAVANMLADKGVLPVNWFNRNKQDAKQAKVRHFMGYANNTGALDKPENKPVCVCKPETFFGQTAYKATPVCDQFIADVFGSLCGRCHHPAACHSTSSTLNNP